jgi:tRNA-2-methylthio-N6-dimethylallyladenosine synthase
MKHTFFLETYGCQMNAAESFSLEHELSMRGWEQVASEHEADLVILNTCAVRTSAEQRIHGRIGYYHHLKESRDISLVVMGCMTERMKGSLREQFPTVNMLVGTFGKPDFLDFLSRAESLNEKRDFFGEDVYEFLSAQVAPGGHSAFVPIMHGCNNFCTYCIVPYVRGRELSRDETEILDEVRRLDSEGVREITLIGQNVNSYRGESDFPQLLRRIESEVTGIKWIRFMSSHPKDLSDDLIETIAASKRLCNHIHLPVQHGSTAVLKAMNRGYSREEYLHLTEKIRSRIGECSLSTDILIGFPGETEQDFEDTLRLLEEVGFDDAFTYKYNPREGTAAASYAEQVSEADKSRRLSRLIDLQRKITEDKRRARVGKTVSVLVEGPSRKSADELLGRTERNEMVVFPRRALSPGDFVHLRLENLSGVTFRAKED